MLRARLDGLKKINFLKILLNVFKLIFKISEYFHITQNPDGKIYIEFNDKPHVYNRRSFFSCRDLLDIQHISPINLDVPIYGSARSRPLSLRTLRACLAQLKSWSN